LPEHMSTRAKSPVWDKARHQDRRPFLLARNDITAGLRRWFGQNRFVEVETASLQVSPGNETHLHAVSALLTGADGGKLERYLHTSPEFAMKKLLAAGESRIVNFARVARDRELTALHAPEFTMLEWYRANEPYETVMADTIALVRVAAEAVAAGRLTWAGRNIDPDAEPEWLSVAEAFQRYAAIRAISDDGDREGFGLVLVEALGCKCATVVTDLPAMHDIVRNGRSALVIPEKNSAQLSEKVNLLLDDAELRQKLGEQGRADVLERFDWEVIDRRYTDLISSLIN
jgi:lysyl-tRNA synthetase class 2